MMLAYLDPGSGSALVGTLIAVAGAGLYSLKSFLYRLVRKPTPEEVDAAKNANPDIAIFSEGKNYCGTFKEIVTRRRSWRMPSRWTSSPTCARRSPHPLDIG